MSERDGYEPGVPCWVAAVEPGGPAPHGGVDVWIAAADAAAERAAPMGRSVVPRPYDVPGIRRAVLADPQGAGFTVSRLVIASPGA